MAKNDADDDDNETSNYNRSLTHVSAHDIIES